MKAAYGPMVLYEAIQKMSSTSLSKVRTLCEDLGNLDLRKFAGENMVLYQTKALEFIREIQLHSAEPVTDLAAIALKGVQRASDAGLKQRAIQLLDEAELSSADNFIDPEEALETLAKYYENRCERKVYEPQASIQAKETAALKAEIQKLKQDRQAGSNRKPRADHSQLTCHHCKKKGHIKPNCPDLPRSGSGPSSSGSSNDSRHNKNGLDEETAKKINALAKEKLEALGPMTAIDATAEHSLSMDGKVVGKLCIKCKRFTKGSTMHFTSEHRGGRTAPPGGGAPPARGNLASFDRSPTPPPAPAATGHFPAAATVDYGFGHVDDDDSDSDSAYEAFGFYAPVKGYRG